MLKCPNCSTPLVDECVEKFDFGMTNADYTSIDEISSCRCNNCQLVFPVHRIYKLEEEFFENA